MEHFKDGHPPLGSWVSYELTTWRDESSAAGLILAAASKDPFSRIEPSEMAPIAVNHLVDVFLERTPTSADEEARFSELCLLRVLLRCLGEVDASTGSSNECLSAALNNGILEPLEQKCRLERAKNAISLLCLLEARRDVLLPLLVSNSLSHMWPWAHSFPIAEALSPAHST